MKKVLLTESELKDFILSLIAKILGVDVEKLKNKKIDTKKIEDKLDNALKDKEKKQPNSGKKITGKVKLVANFNSEQQQNIKYLINYMEDAGITNPYTQIGILSLISKECNFIPKSEVDYCKTKNSHIRKTFGSRVPASDSELNSLKCDPKKFFNRVYAKTVGNRGGNDGWLYRGRGFNQLTGIKNYEKYSKMAGFGTKLVENPDLLNQPEIAAKVALAFLTKGKSPSTFPNFTDKEEAAIYFADINAGGRPSSHRGKAIEATKKFDVVT